MLRKDVGVVLRSARSGETSKLITFLGRHSGKVNLLGKGAMGSQNPFRGLLEVGNLIEVVYYDKAGRTLFFLKEVYVRLTLGSLRDSLPHLATALAILELVESVCYWGSPEERAVDLLAEAIACPPADDPLHLYLSFAFKLLEVLGVVPDLSSCASCGGDISDGYYYPADGTSTCRKHSKDSPHRVRLGRKALDYVAGVAQKTLADLSTIGSDRAARKRFGEILHWTYTFHIQSYRLPKALKLVPRGD